MTVTVAALKRAAEDCAEAPGLVTHQRTAFEQLCQDPAMLTILAERLSVRPCLGCVNVDNACDACRPNLQRVLDLHFGRSPRGAA